MKGRKKKEERKKGEEKRRKKEKRKKKKKKKSKKNVEEGKIELFTKQQVNRKDTPPRHLETFCQGVVWPTHDVHHEGFAPLVILSGCLTGCCRLVLGYLQAFDTRLVPTSVIAFS